MNEFAIIEHYFQQQTLLRPDVLVGIGDDGACVALPPGHQLVITTDTLVADVHFFSHWDPYDIAYRAVMVNLSDVAAMAATPCWASLALTIPDAEPQWLAKFSAGLYAALNLHKVSLIGGDTTKGPLTITLTLHSIVPNNQAVCRKGASSGDAIWLSGSLGAAALAMHYLTNQLYLPDDHALWSSLLKPPARLDLTLLLREYASAAIDISDGLSADLNHLCQASNCGAILRWQSMPIYTELQALPFCTALQYIMQGGDDYELCFTVPLHKHSAFKVALQQAQISCYEVGRIETQPGLRILLADNTLQSYVPQGYCHF